MVNASQTTGAVRPTTREAWRALLAEGKSPSVRSVYGRVGGKYTRLAAECRCLRAEGNGALEASSGGAEFGNHGKSIFSKTYVCARFPRLRLSHIRFRDGRYETSDPDEQALIERADWYGVHIHEGQG